MVMLDALHNLPAQELFQMVCEIVGISCCPYIIREDDIIFDVESTPERSKDKQGPMVSA